MGVIVVVVPEGPAPQSGDVSGIDENDIVHRATAAAQEAYPGSRVHGLRRLEGGVSSLTFASTLRESEGTETAIVIKVAPPGLPAVRNRDVLRQARVLNGLAGLDGFPVPRVVLEADGDPPLFAMELRPGASYEPLLDVTDDPPSPSDAGERMRVAARALARLHAPEPAAFGLTDEPVLEPAEELRRWERLFETADDDLAPGHRDLCARLRERVPAPVQPTLQHGDYRSANMLFVGPRLEAVIDWEIWSVGDPRFDLCWLLMHTDPPHVFFEDRPPADRLAGSQCPGAGDLLEEYLRTRRADGASAEVLDALVADLDWFLAVCVYKTASTIAAIVKRERKLPEPKERLMVAARHLGATVQAGQEVLDRGPAFAQPSAEWRKVGQKHR